MAQQTRKKATRKKAAKKKATKKKAVRKKTASKKTSRKGIGGRPKFKIDYESAEKLATMQCTVTEIAEFLGCSRRTLERDAEFGRIHKRGLERGKASLRRLQWKSAEKGNQTMLIWLGKQYLGQKDKHEHAGDSDQPLEVRVTRRVVDPDAPGD